MIYVGIDVAKDKHDCLIINSEGEVLSDVFTIANSKDGFDKLLKTIKTRTDICDSKIKVGLEATEHYSYNLIGFLLDNGLSTYVINPLHTNLYRKSQTLRKTKTDRVDARTIASMLMSDVGLKAYTNIAYHNSELKSLARYRFDKVRERATLKTSIARLVNILFPELEKLLPTLHIVSSYALLSEFPSAKHIAETHLTRLTKIYSILLLKVVTTEIKPFKSEMLPKTPSVLICRQKPWNSNIPLNLLKNLTKKFLKLKPISSL